MTVGPLTVISPVQDMAKAKAVYAALLGVEPAVEAPFYVGFEVAGHHVGLDPNGARHGMTGPEPFWHVDDIEASTKALVSAGAPERQPARDVGGGRLIAKHADGKVTCLLQDPRG